MKESVCAALILGLAWAGFALLAAPMRAIPPDPEPQSVSETVAVCSDAAESDTEEASAAEAEQKTTEASASFDCSFRLPVLRDGSTVSMDLHTYLTGVLLGELPPGFAPEAMKAQAVASRTYALYGYAHRRHDGAAVCTDPGCCQAWRDPADADPAVLAAAAAAVSETDGLTVCCGGKLIEATFFSCSGGRTEDAVAVWGTDLPYLRAVDSPGEEEADCFSDERRISAEEFCKILRQADPAVSFPPEQGAWVGTVTYTDGGGVDRIELGGRLFTGTQIRQRFGLRSTVFQIRVTADGVVFSTRGNGHRVGMSQYGAQAMAESGAGFEEILTHYYQGTEICAADSLPAG